MCLEKRHFFQNFCLWIKNCLNMIQNWCFLVLKEIQNTLVHLLTQFSLKIWIICEISRFRKKFTNGTLFSFLNCYGNYIHCSSLENIHQCWPIFLLIFIQKLQFSQKNHRVRALDKIFRKLYVGFFVGLWYLIIWLLIKRYFSIALFEIKLSL